MLYMLLLYSDPTIPFPDDGMEKHFRFADKTRADGAYVLSEALRGVEEAKTVRLAQGNIVTDGPFAETKEVLGGFYLLDCKDMEQATEYAKLLPHGTVEIRPVMHIDGWPYEAAADRERVPMNAPARPVS